MGESTLIELISKLGSSAIVIAFLFYGLKYFIQKNEELFKALNDSHTTTNDKYIDLLKKQSEDHAKCSDSYISISSRLEEVIRNNTDVIKEIRESVEAIK